MQDWTQIKHFKKSEFDCKCGCGLNNINFDFVKKLDDARTIANAPFFVSSGCRCSAYNKRVGGVENSAHVCGFAVDIRAEDSITRFNLLSAFFIAGFSRIGIYPAFIHVDLDMSKPQSLIWLNN